MRRGLLGLACLGVSQVSTTAAMGAPPAGGAAPGGAEPLKMLPKWEPPTPGYQVQPWEASPPALAASSIGGGGGPPPEPLVQYGNPFLYGDTPLGGPAVNNRPQYPGQTSGYPEYPNSKYPYSDAGDRDRRQCMTTCLLQVASYYSSSQIKETGADPAQIAEAQMGVIAGCNPSALGAPSIVAGVPLLMGSKLRSIDFASEAVQALVTAMASNVLSGGSGSGTTMAAHVLVNQLLSMPPGDAAGGGAKDKKGAKSKKSKDKGAAAGGEPGQALLKWLMVASLQSGANRESVNGLLLDMLLARPPPPAADGKGKKKGKGSGSGAGSETTDFLLKAAIMANAGGTPAADLTAPRPPEVYVANVHHRCMETILGMHPPPPLEALESVITSCVNSQLQTRQADYAHQKEMLLLKDGQNKGAINPLMMAALMRPSGAGSGSSGSKSKSKSKGGGDGANPDMAMVTAALAAQQGMGPNQGNQNQFAQQYLLMNAIKAGAGGASGGKSKSKGGGDDANPDMATISAALAMQQGMGPNQGNQNQFAQQYLLMNAIKAGAGGASGSKSKSKSGGDGANPDMAMLSTLAMQPQQGMGPQQGQPNTLAHYFMLKSLMSQGGSSGGTSKGKGGAAAGGGMDVASAMALSMAHNQGFQQQQGMANMPFGGGGNVAGNNYQVGKMIMADPKAKPEAVAGNLAVISSGAMMGVAGQPIQSSGSIYGACVTVVLNGLIGDTKLKGKDIEPQIAQCTATGYSGMSNGDLACMACLNKAMADPKAKTKKSKDLLPSLNACVIYALMTNTANTVNPVAGAVAVQARADGPEIRVLDDDDDNNGNNDKNEDQDVTINIGGSDSSDNDDNDKDENANDNAANPTAPMYAAQTGFVAAQPAQGLIETSSGIERSKGRVQSLRRDVERTQKLRGGKARKVI
jgi:hypothetical protein